MKVLRDWILRFSGNSTLLSILMILLGAVLVIWPGATLVIATRILGCALLGAGLVSAISWYKDRHSVQSTYLSLGVAVICAIAGIVVLAAPNLVASILPWIIGVFIFINGVLNLAKALDLRSARYNYWGVTLALAIVTILLGVLIVFNPLELPKMLIIAIGVSFIYDGASNLWINHKYKKYGY